MPARLAGRIATPRLRRPLRWPILWLLRPGRDLLPGTRFTGYDADVGRSVLSLPKHLRYFLHHDPALIGPVLQMIFLEAVEDRLKARSPAHLRSPDRTGRRCCLSCPWSLKRTSVLAGDLLSLRRCAFLERLATLIPPPRRHRRSSHGVLAPAVFAGSKTGQR
ncbi:MAG: hypothetical protein ACREXU_01180 [Gammaproteobacteria bacterium]